VVLLVTFFAVFVRVLLCDRQLRHGARDPALSRRHRERRTSTSPTTHITDAVEPARQHHGGRLGIVITVVSIVVQLSAERYTGVTKMFLKDRTNMLVMAYYVVACVCGIWLQHVRAQGVRPGAARSSR